ncbi:MAG: hypothetical protein Q8L66_01090 [Caulobacter sp.]|nr:hypothetical protein [Caulobacter sp.]
MTLRMSDLQIQACQLFDEALKAEDQGELVEAEALYRVAAELGYDLAMNSLAVLIEDRMTPPRPAEAVYWLKRAVAAGSSNAAWNLAMRHRLEGRRRWYVHWLRIAETLGDTEAAEILAVATTRDDSWWAIEGVNPPPFVRGPRLV